MLSSEEPELQLIASWDHNYVVLDVKTAADHIVVCDAVSSFAILTLDESRLLTAVKSYTPLWPVCMSIIDDNTVIGANVSETVSSPTDAYFAIAR